MNLLISIDEEIYRHAQNVSEDSNDEWNAMRAIANGTPIPDNATNGDVVKILLADFMYVPWKEWLMIDLDWWNAPYQKGGK